ncbi:TRAP transporter permease [Pseudalkalibacillus sp. A8]|uniref:TRAP transporter permease n=1 Tax=Pseudalkalibacillus sp. A8 TaxID=3382641 RepID=UPI0038B5FBC2
MKLKNINHYLIIIVAISMSSFHIYTAILGSLEGMLQRNTHLLFAIILIFLVYPITKNREPTNKYIITNWLITILASSPFLWIIYDYSRIIERWPLADVVTTNDLIFGSLALVVILEITRRTMGVPMLIIATTFILYALYGQNLPGIASHRGYGLPMIIDQLFLTTEGIFGVALSTSATFVFLFILFGAFLENTKAGKFYMDIAFATTGKTRGGPAKSAVVASGLMGSVSGSAIANVVTTGSLTIPLMKKVGYKPNNAGAIETAASVGGQITPPLMGASALIMAEFTGIPFAHIILVSIIPAIIYFLSVLLMVHFSAIKNNIEGEKAESLPNLVETLKEGWHLVIPLGVLVWLLIEGRTPVNAAIWGIISVIIVCSLRKGTRLKMETIFKSLIEGAKASLIIAAATACAGIIIGIFSLTGLGMQFSSLIINISNGQLFLALVLVAISCIIIGMGLPVVAAYIVMSVMAAPALVDLGVDLLIAHLSIIWFTQLSNVTPPVCLAAYAGSAIAKGDPIKTGWISLKYAIGILVLPFVFVYNPLLLNGSIIEIVITIVSTLTGFIALTSSFESHLVKHLNNIQRILLFISSIALFIPVMLIKGVGLTLLIIVFFWQYKQEDTVSIKSTVQQSN